MRVAFVGASHWHAPFYLEPVARSSECMIVGVADPDDRAANDLAREYSTRAFVDYRAMSELTEPDLVFVLGRHVDMAAEARFLIEARIPLVIEKPCGVTVAEIEDLEQRARRAGVFAAVPFAYRYSHFCRLVRDRSPGAELTYGMFRQVPGPVRRYREWNVPWNLDRSLAGGGCTLNLSIHFFDLVRVLAPSASWAVSAATMSNELSGTGVEDFSAVTLESGGRRATVETGYFFPTSEGETLLSANMGGDYYRWDGSSRTIVVTGDDGRSDSFPAGSSQVEYYQTFVADVLARLSRKEPPEAGLAEMVEAAKMAERAYRLAGDTISMT